MEGVELVISQRKLQRGEVSVSVADNAPEALPVAVAAVTPAGGPSAQRAIRGTDTPTPGPAGMATVPANVRLGTSGRVSAVTPVMVRVRPVSVAVLRGLRL